MKKIKIILIAIASSLLSIVNSYAQKDSIHQHQKRIEKNPDQYPYINTPNHQTTPPPINGTFDDPKIIPDSTAVNKDNRSRENPDSIRTRLRSKPDFVPNNKNDTLN
jgi:hypothetical protein